MADKKLVCKDCNSEFVFTEGEQQFYAEKGFTNEPQRCPDCRKANKAAKRGFGGGSRSDRGGYGGGYGGGNRGGYGNRY